VAILDQELAAAKEGIARLKSRIKEKDIASRDLSEERANFVMPMLKRHYSSSPLVPI
jgi:hypothetical protein